MPGFRYPFSIVYTGFYIVTTNGSKSSLVFLFILNRWIYIMFVPSIRKIFDSKFNVYYIMGVSTVAGLVYFGYTLSSKFIVQGEVSDLPIGWFVIVAAVLGSLLNEPFRKEVYIPETISFRFLYVLWKCSVSVVFAFLFYLISVGELIQIADLVPKFTVKDGFKEGWDVVTFLHNVEPESYKDIARLMIWCFLAGYSEKFVPNILQSLEARLND